MTQEFIIGIAWFDEAQWQLLTEVVPDRNELDDSFEAWERSARDTVRMIEARGHKTRRVPIDVAALCAWCRERRLPVNGAARAQYVSSILDGTRSGT